MTGRWQAYKAALVVAVGLSCVRSALAGENEAFDAAVPVALAVWQQRGAQVILSAPLAEALTAKQKAIINAGFTTVTQLTVTGPEAAAPGVDGGASVIYSLRCSVKFDAWEETYDVARLDDMPRAVFIKQFAPFGELCFTAQVTRAATLAALAPKGGSLLARIVVRQTSQDEANRIREWLVQQQSGVMQGLFSHMLGEINLNQTLDIRISVPPQPPQVGGQEADAPPSALARPETGPRSRAQPARQGVRRL